MVACCWVRRAVRNIALVDIRITVVICSLVGSSVMFQNEPNYRKVENVCRSAVDAVTFKMISSVQRHTDTYKYVNRSHILAPT